MCPDAKPTIIPTTPITAHNDPTIVGDHAAAETLSRVGVKMRRCGGRFVGIGCAVRVGEAVALAPAAVVDRCVGVEYLHLNLRGEVRIRVHHAGLFQSHPKGQAILGRAVPFWLRQFEGRQVSAWSVVAEAPVGPG